MPNRRWLQRSIQASILCTAMVVMLGAGRSRFDRLGHEMMCVCGCGQYLLECNHVGCPDSDRMIRELRDQLSGTAGDTAVFNWFIVKYGATVLAAPIRGGFDTVAWITPLAVFVLATGGTAALVWSWRRRFQPLAASVPEGLPEQGPLSPEAAALRDRIRRETEYR